MASLTTKKDDKGKPRGCFIACYREWDASKGRMVNRQRSTGVRVDEKKKADAKSRAKEVAKNYETAALGVARVAKGESGETPGRLYKSQLDAIWRAAGLVVPTGGISWREASGRYLRERLVSDIAKSTEEAYRGYDGAFTKWLGDRASSPLSMLSFDDYNGFHADYLLTHAPKTARQQLRYITAVVGRCLELGELGEGARNHASLVVTSNRTVTAKRPFTAPEVQSIFNYLRRESLDEWAFACMAAYHNGFRMGDATTLKASDFITHTDGRVVVMVSPAKKNRQGKRQPIAFPCVGEFREMYLQMVKRVETPGGRITPGLPRKSAASKGFIRILEAAGVEVTRAGAEGGRQVANISFHSWRYTSKSNMDNAGVSNRVADRINDHDDAKVAAAYSDISIEAMEEAVGKSVASVWA